MEISELKEGDKFYQVSSSGKYIVWYEYFSEMPVKNPVNKGKYFIFINNEYQPVRFYKDKVEELLSKNLRTYNEALLISLKNIEDDLEYVKQQLLKLKNT